MKIPGHCSVCGEACFEILEWYEDGALAGTPKKLGQPHDDASRITVILLDGSQMGLTVHAGCVDLVPQALPRIWREINERYTLERDRCDKDFRARARTEAQRAISRATHVKFLHNIPLGVLAVEKWTDVSTSQ